MEDLQAEILRVKTDAAEMADFAANHIEALEARINQLLPLARAYESIDMILRIGQNNTQSGSFSEMHRLRNKAAQLREEVDKEKEAAYQAAQPKTP